MSDSTPIEHASSDDRRIVELAKEYFRRVDAGAEDLLDLFTDGVQFYFPKFGIGRGKMAFVEFAEGLQKLLSEAHHDFSNYLFLPYGHFLAVEGTTEGRTPSGKTWFGGRTPGGRFCNIFEFQGDLISRVHIYLDPDYGSDDRARFAWGTEGREW
ncbi:nuclear transport factor 2 family protein [Polymorphobacter sp. PAMC 29334]|uniref:nuclear transport factor 2 family protein n=1 Tax=Polymorphobacter sp. PAMC 29334 TaxID=2862331 RepID=UPI001C66862A|nr:nuclear transport factor 2 family protein [Polymorphobacter sp. PAMC 29334]QYE36355.1 nuclear transport factor 2 family protein [Polymorphobacter sp. PAMC 29334]